MLRAERLNHIMIAVNQHEIIKIDALVQIAKVSKATIRRDIEELVSRGLIQKTRGGVMSAERVTAAEPCFRTKNSTHAEEKARIARAALSHIDYGDHVLLDAGTTVLELAKLIKSGKNITTVTYDLLIAMEIARHSNVDLMLVGGTLRRNYYSVYGYFAEKMLRDIRVNKAFLSADSIDLKQGIMSYTADDISLKKLIIECSNEVILLCDHSKFEANAFINIAPLDLVSRIIVGREISEPMLRRLKETGVTVELA